MRHGYLYFGVIGLVGLVGLYLVLALNGIDGWWVLLAMAFAAAGLGGCWVLAREGLKAEDGYHNWRRTVWQVSALAQAGRLSISLKDLVGPLNDRELLELWGRIQNEEQEWERGGHSER